MRRATVVAGALVAAASLLVPGAAAATPTATPPATAPSAAAASASVPTLRPDQALAEQDAACAVPSTRDLAVTRAVHRVGTEMRVSAKVMLAGFEAGWVESHMHNLSCGDRDSLGVFQQRPSQGWGTRAQILDVDHAARAFFREAQRIESRYGGSSAGALAQGVQRSAYPSRYDQARSTAERLLAEARPLARPAARTPADRYPTDDNRRARTSFPFGTSADEHFSGDWDGDGVDTPGQRQGTTIYIARDERGTDVVTFRYGWADSDLVVGDWDGDGRDSIGIASGNGWYLRNSLSSGTADLTYSYGFAGSTKVVGDWDGDGVDTPGVVAGNRWFLRNRHAGGAADLTFGYGPSRGDKLVGDWDGDGRDTPGVRAGNTWLLRNSASGGAADVTAHYGRATDVAVTGDWDGDRRDSAGVSRAR
ncbi:hypothetical protein WDZ17_14130 [Pseudokineococcus basanitobsidens]|uniref:VCBS repeat protein n=1 Tax=Pseudokineococcus basanitobsidens TaxID=1926649 RepID=A0ABU8RN09_9ACTN